MAIVIETIAAPGATPIARDAASQKSFVNDYYKLAVPDLSTRDRKTISILGLIYELTAAGGANYKSNHAGLIQDSTVYTGGISLFSLCTAMAATDWNGGKAADATLSTDISTLLGEGRDLDNKSEDELDRMIAFLRAQLGK
jgi:hypothetical protein